jgi:predicted AlkP superfamily phosphohydrolase/phosphomutase
MHKRRQQMCRLLVIGLDGAHWELIEPWIQNGELPTIKRFCKEGVWANMESCLPPVTSPNWKCYSTGKNPGKLGVFWWENIDVENRNISIPQSYDFKSQEIWDYMGEQGLKTAIINMPTTYPPKKVNGCMIAGGPGCEERNYTYPKKLERELKKRFNYRIHTLSDITNLRRRDNKVIDEVKKLIDQRFEVAEYLIETGNYDFIHLTIFLINVLQHFLWDDDIVKQIWERIDGNIAKLIGKASNVILMSDHGSNRIKREFYINNWLEQEGYLTIKRTISDFLFEFGINKEGLNRALNYFPFSGLMRRATPKALRKKILSKSGVLKKAAKVDKVNWKKTKVIASGQGPIYLNVAKNSSAYNELRREITKKLEDLKDPEGNKVVCKAYLKEEIYSGEYLDKAPDIVVDQNNGYHINGGIGGKDIFTKPKKWAAENKKEGLFAAWGKDIRRGYISNVKIIDLAPTILHWLEIPVPEDIDGKVLKKIFKKNSEFYNKKRKYHSPMEKTYTQDDTKEKEKIKRRLQDLGYLD